MSHVIEVDGLAKTYRTGFRRKRVQAVKGISFSVEPGEIFGFLGPNGAGKTTTIRMLMGLIHPTAGRASIFGHQVPSRAARARLGFLPETPYFHEYLTVLELLDLAGRLFGMGAAARASRGAELVTQVGLDHAKKKPLKSFSKGMLQRAGIAQALMNDPELVVLDEPMGGLDPVGRKEVRDIILALRDRGKTVFFSSHILADVEMIADRIAIITHGEIRDVGTLSQLVADTVIRTDVSLRITGDFTDDAVAELEGQAMELRRREGEILAALAPDVDVDEFLARTRSLGARVISVVPHHETLEDVFYRRAKAEPAGAPP
jgi:ABC-2 type transport system ATP-binding protein